MEVKHSKYFDETYTIKGAKGHYYLENAKYCHLHDAIKVKRMLHSGKRWEAEDVYFKTEVFKELKEKVEKLNKKG